MQARLEMFVKVSEAHGEMLRELDILNQIALVRIKLHDKYAWEQALSEVEESKDSKTESYLIAGSFLAQRAWYTSGAISCLLWHGYADAAYESWRTLFNIAVVLSDILNSDDPDKTAERYLDYSLAEFHYHEREIAMDLETSSVGFGELDAALSLLENTYGKEITQADGWIKAKPARRMKNRAKLAGMLDLYCRDYQLASKSVHASALSMIKRPSVELKQDEIPAVEPSDKGVQHITMLTAILLDQVVDAFIYETRQVELPEEKKFREDFQKTLSGLGNLLKDWLEQNSQGSKKSTSSEVSKECG